MGAVYEARQEPLNRRVALKTLHPQYACHHDAIARFFNEAKVLSVLAHPSLVQVSDFVREPNGTVYLVMEYLRGQSLGGLLASCGGRLSVMVALQLAWQVAEVLAVAHAQGVIHRDLKPENLMLVPDPVAPGGERVKVLDFGIAKLTSVAEHSSVATDAKAVMGTPMYMSPEQCSGAGNVDGKSDVYSLGCVLFQTLAGRPPFVGEGTGHLIGMHLFQEPPMLASLLPELPRSVSEFVQRLLIKDKELRPSMAQVADELAKLLFLSQPEDRPASPLLGSAHMRSQGQWLPRAGPRWRLRALLVGAAALTMSALAGPQLRTPIHAPALRQPEERVLNEATAFPELEAAPSLASRGAEPPSVAAAVALPIQHAEKSPSPASSARLPRGSVKPSIPSTKDADISAFFPGK